MKKFVHAGLHDILVAKVIEHGKIVINKGSDDGILNYMEFLVYTEGDEIYDPQTGESLGILENPKGKFKVLSIQPTMSTLITTQNYQVSPITSINSRINLNTGIEAYLLESIQEGDKVKIINKI